ncbi:putative alpha-mannosidase I MNS5 [Abeliophyllum distichum]|uniref:Alpha-mannosidase I MNS5 n=1 Tax=Abeliophyllum distichum TaxID=126358 RepID=A0ABD1RXF3_9LAMI
MKEEEEAEKVVVVVATAVVVAGIEKFFFSFACTEWYLLDHQMLHPTEKYYPLRPELAESTFYLYQATKDPWYLDVGESIVDSLNFYTRVEGGYASIRDVTTMELEDHQHSFFLSETSWHEKLPEAYILGNFTSIKSEEQPKRSSAMSLRICPAAMLNDGHNNEPVESACHIPDTNADHRCVTDEDYGVDSTSCRRRSCSVAGYCGLWLLI